MTTMIEDRLLGLAVAALSITISGELAGIGSLATFGATTFAAAIAALFVAMPLSLLVGLSRTSGPDMQPVRPSERAR